MLKFMRRYVGVVHSVESFAVVIYVQKVDLCRYIQIHISKHAFLFLGMLQRTCNMYAIVW